MSDAETCVELGCALPSVAAFGSHPEDARCQAHHDRELRRRIACLEAAKHTFIALVGAS